MTDSNNDTSGVDAPPPAIDGTPIKEEKLQSIMEAANALTALGDEEDASDANAVASPLVPIQLESDAPSLQPSKDDTATPLKPEQPPQQQYKPVLPTKRFLPDHKKPDAAPTFPEKMMALMRFVDQFKDDETYCAAWLPDGKSFVVRKPDDFARSVVPQFFKATKFSSFTRKLYRWGFRQINRGIGPDDPVIFGNEFFDRDNEGLMSRMRSVTAAGTRKSDSRTMVSHNSYGKRPLDGGANMYDMNDPQKRFLYEQFMQQQKNAQLMNHNPSLYSAMSTNGGPMNPGYPPPPPPPPPHMYGQSPGVPSQQPMHMPYMPPQPSPAQHLHTMPGPQTPQDMGISSHMGPSSGGGGMGLPNVSGHSQGGGSYNMGNGSNQNTAEIVNAAIRALQYSS